MMYRYGSHLCQAVRGMDVKLGWAYWDNEDDNSKNYSEGSAPSAEIGKDLKFYYCHYSPKK